VFLLSNSSLVVGVAPRVSAEAVAV